MGKHVYIVDTNVVLEYLLDQTYFDLAHQVLKEIDFRITKFSFDALFVVGSSRKFRPNVMHLLTYFLSKTSRSMLEFSLDEALDIYSSMPIWQLDFDDAHLKFIAEREGLKVLTFDKHLLKYPDIAVHPEQVL